MKRLARELVNRMADLTSQKAADLAMANAELNQSCIQHTILDLARKKAGAEEEKESSKERSEWAIVIAAGPSLHRKDPVAQILESGYDGTIISADGSLGHCLRSGLVPDYVLTLDPHPRRIVRWFGDPDLASQDEDDYFRRQDLDPHLGIDEAATNRELIQLIDEHGPRIKAVIATSASQRVTERCLEAGMELYWWNPVLDDFDAPNSLTARVYHRNKVPCMVSGGNVGSAAWVFAHAILKKKEIAVVGMDLSYAPGTPLEKTQYYKEIVDIFGERALDAYINVYNSYLKETWFTDPAYYWYRQTFLQMAREADCITFNCTEGGILFGKGVRFIPLREFLASRGYV